MLRVTSSSLIVPPFECAWLSLNDHQLSGSCCLEFECKGENDVTIILKPFPGAKRWQHLQRQQGPAGAEQLAVEANYTVILGSHRNSKLKIERNGEEMAVAMGLPGCTVSAGSFTSCWINYSNGSIAVGTGSVGSSLSYIWHDPEPAIADIQYVGLSCWDKHVSYRNVQLLPALTPARMQELQVELQEKLAAAHMLQQQHAQQQQQQQQQPPPDQPVPQQQQQQQQDMATQQGSSTAALLPSSRDATQACTGQHQHQQQHQQQQQQQQHDAEPAGCVLVPSLLQLVQAAIIAQLQPCDVCHLLQLSEALLPRTQALYEAAVQLAGECLAVLVQQHLQELAMLSMDVLMDVLHEPLLDVPELCVFEAVAAWCQADGALLPTSSSKAAASMPPAAAEAKGDLQQQHPGQQCLQQHGYYQQSQQLGVMQSQPITTGLLPARHTQQQQEHHEQQQQQPQQPQHACCRAAADVMEVLQLVRFALMSEPERQAVLDHPFTKECPLVTQCLEDDLRRLQEYHSRRPSPTSQAGFHCQQRRLLLPACAALSSASTSSSDMPGTCQAQCSGVADVPSTEAGPGSMSERCNSAPAAASSQVQIALDNGLQQQQQADQSHKNSSSSSSTVVRPTLGWLGRSASSDARTTVSSWRSYRRRLAPSCRELMFVCDGDRNGVIHFIATEYGTKPWVNPVLSKALDIKASSPPSRYTDPKAIVSGQFLNTSFAGPRYVRTPQPATLPAAPADATAGNASSQLPSTWWQVDLGPKHRLMCNYYVIRHDGSHEGFARSWALQGSNDLHHWFDLRRHVDDSTIRLPGQYGSWPVSGPAACMPFRAFRLILLGPTQSQTNPWAFCLSYWELYGMFCKLRNAGSSTPPAAAAAAAGAP